MSDTEKSTFAVKCCCRLCIVQGGQTKLKNEMVVPYRMRWKITRDEPLGVNDDELGLYKDELGARHFRDQCATCIPCNWYHIMVVGPIGSRVRPNWSLCSG